MHPLNTFGSAVDGGAKLRPIPGERVAVGEAFNNEWAFFERAPDRPASFVGTLEGYVLFRTSVRRPIELHVVADLRVDQLAGRITLLRVSQ